MSTTFLCEIYPCLVLMASEWASVTTLSFAFLFSFMSSDTKFWFFSSFSRIITNSDVCDGSAHEALNTGHRDRASRLGNNGAKTCH